MVVANGSAEVSAGSTHPFELDGLEHSTAYTVHFVVEDEPGVFSNITSEAFTSASPPEIALSTVAQNPCFEEANGSASAVITGGVAPHTTIWSSGESTPEISGKEAGAYTISVSENGGCPAAEETAVIELDDQIAPSAIAKDAVLYLDEDGNAELTVEMIDDHSFDECGIADLTITQTEFTCADTGEESEIDVFLTASDEAGNVSTALAKVTVLDTLKPRVFAQDIDVELNAEGIALISPGMANNGSFDNCSISNFTLSKTEFNCDEIGENEVTLTATDASGNSAEASFTVRVKDDTAPVASAVENPVLYLNAEGSAVPSTDAFFENISDNCQLTSESFDVDAFSCADVGAQEINITLSDPSGNSLNVASEVMIADTISPQFNLESIELESDLNGEASLTPEMLVDHAFDACGVAEITVENELWTCAESGQETNVTVTDINGNAKSFALTVVLTDNIAPVILAEGTIVSLGEDGRFNLNPEILNCQVTDNCSDVDVTLSRSRVYCDDIGMVPVTLTATDASGNSSQYTVMVEVVDDMAPVIDLPYTVYLCAGAQYDYHDFLSSSDNCDYTLIQIAGPTSDSRLTPGLYYARFKATDSSGNVTYEGCNIEVLEYPEVDLGDDLTIAPGLLVGLTAGTDPELNYEWSTGHDTPYIELYVTGNMTVTVAVSNQGGCTSYDEINISTSTATGTAEMENGSSFTLYPNPATDRINLDFELYGDLKDATVRITDIQGKVVGMEQLAHVKNGETRNINVNHLSQGMYILTISTNEMRMSTKFSRQ